MSAFPTLTVDLAARPDARWAALRPHAATANAMVRQYLGDLARGADRGTLQGLVAASETVAVPESLRGEIDSVADVIRAARIDVLTANLYYDAFRVLMGCTAFAIDADDGPLHARNLDWWTEGGLLSRATTVTRFENGPAGRFTTVGWPGLVGAFSGVADGRFAITMNAVLSEEKPTLALSTPMLIRDVLERARDYVDAKHRLATTPIASDCLLLLTGAARGELCVIERTSTRSAIREAEDGIVAVTNDYRALDTHAVSTSALSETAGDRLAVAWRRARAERPRDAASALAILRDANVQMLITVQQMVLHARSGRCVVEAPPPR